jgi:hypothetical protein
MPLSNTLELIEWLIRYLEQKNYRVNTVGATDEWDTAEIGFVLEQMRLIRSQYMVEGDIK